ncbi:serine/threonine-protein phosphatase 6 regulatory ankyrin repeat subunit C-like [Schistocerca nitens]|uniref:serine/threonine-protein phosphatase 6 regulatory ankyrin repeat subunit C-like n=1 Tax=Schistocerca nitens TaxID=7011 RepID=UPI0021190604|nr:serine/threonine-protein phosphatase 6 regulatory ankyrin repeat subunit C-like [Schistocerca nitens]
MFCGSISWFICIFVAVVIAVNCSDSDSITGPDLEVNVLRLRSENPEQSTVVPETEGKETPAVGLSALLDAGEGAVVTLVAGDTRLAAHRAVLASRSAVFEAMFRQDPLEASSGQVAVQDVEGPVLRQLLAYLYTLQAPQLPGMSAQLLAAADKYGVSALKAECELQLAAQLSVETAAATAALAVRHSSDSLKQAAIKFIRAHLVQVIFTRGWADAVHSQPQDMADVYRLLLETPMETSTPAVGDSDRGATPTPATQPHSDHGGTPATAAPPTTQRPAAPPDGNALSLLRYAGAHREANTGTPLQTPSNTTAQRQRPPATADGRTTPATELHSNRGWTSVTAAPPTTLHSTLWPDGSTASTLHTPASTESSVAPTTQLQSNHGDLSRTSASAATPTAASATPSTDSAAITLLRSLSGEQKGRRLIQAAKEGSVEELQALLVAGTDVEAMDGNMTALHWAAKRGHVEVARRLLEAGAEVDARNDRNSTPLQMAAESGHAALVRLLIASNADINARNQYEKTAMHYAAQHGHAEIVNTLLEAGAEVDARNDRNSTPLQMAAESGHAALVRLLIASHADVNARNQYEKTAMHYAAEHGHAEIVNTLLEAGAEVDARNDRKSTPLQMAAESGHAALVRLLIASHADINARNQYEKTAMHYAAEHGHAEIVNTLLEAGAEVDARNDRKSTPLQMAAECGHMAVVRLLIASNADTNAKNQYGSTAMHYAAEHGHAEIVNRLLEAGAEVDTRNGKQSTALHIAAWKGHTAVVRLLVASNANPNAVNQFGMTPLHYAAKHGHSEVAALLLEAGANREARDNDGNTSLDLARLNKHQKLIDMLRLLPGIMCGRSVWWFICIFVAIVTDTSLSDPASNTGSDSEVADNRLRTDKEVEPVQRVKETAAVDLAALLDAGDSAVVTLVAGDTRLVAHRAVLIASSTVFAAILRNNTLEASSGHVAISDVEGPVLRHLLAYMYTLQAPQLHSMAPQLLAAAERYGLSALKAECEQLVAARVSGGSAAATAVLEVRHSSNSLRQAVVDFIKAHLLHVMGQTLHSQREDQVEVSRLLSVPPAKASSPAIAVSRMTPSTQPLSDHSWTRDAAAPTTMSTHDTPPPNSVAIALLSSPATAVSRMTPSTQPLSDHSWTRDAAAPTTMSTHDTPPPNSVAIALLRTLSGEEKGRRLIQAAIQGSMEELQALLAAGVNVGARDMNEWTPLHWAAGKGYEEMVRRLLAAGADVGARDKFQQTPLHLAAWGGRPAVVRLLSASSADPNARDVDGWTPLHSAAFNDETEAATALLEAGADRGAVDNNGKTPLDIARQYNQQQVIDVL